jgi:hypothetical protein
MLFVYVLFCWPIADLTVSATIPVGHPHGFTCASISPEALRASHHLVQPRDQMNVSKGDLYPTSYIQAFDVSLASITNHCKHA